MRRDLISSELSSRGTYEKIRLNVGNAEAAYSFVKRTPLLNKYAELLKVVASFEDSGFTLLHSMLSDFEERIHENKKLPYGIEYDAKRLEAVLLVIKAILLLSGETYIRNFSNAMFKDSKVFKELFIISTKGDLIGYFREPLKTECSRI